MSRAVGVGGVRLCQTGAQEGLPGKVSFPQTSEWCEKTSRANSGGKSIVGTGTANEILVLRNLRTGSGPGRALTDLSCRRDVFCIILSITIRLTGGCR